MTAAEKAKELVGKFSSFETNFSYDSGYSFERLQSEDSKHAAIICVDEIIKMFEGLHKPEYTMFDIYEPKQYHMEGEKEFNGYTMSEYWEQVKQAINEL